MTKQFKLVAEGDDMEGSVYVYRKQGRRWVRCYTFCRSGFERRTGIVLPKRGSTFTLKVEKELEYKNDDK